MKSKLYELIKSYSRGVSADLPEATLFGCVKLCLMPETSLELILKDKEITDIETIKESIKESMSILDEKSLDADLMKKGLPILIKHFNGKEQEAYESVVNKYDEGTSLSEILKDALKIIDTADTAEIDVFKSGKGMSDIMKYKDTLKKDDDADKDIEDSSKKEKAKEDAKESNPEEDAKPQEDSDEKEEKGSKASKKKEEKTEEANEEVTEGSKEDPKAEPEEEPEEEEPLYSDALNDFLDEFESMIPKFKDMEAEKFLWSQTLLVSMDNGYGMTSFGKRLAKICIKNGLTNPLKEDADSIFSECVVERKDSRDSQYNDWETAVSIISRGDLSELRRLRRAGETIDNSKLMRIVCIDISQWTTEMDSHGVKEYLKKINAKKDLAFVIFRIPYMDRRVVKQIENSISDIMGVRSLVVPPISTDKMIDYIISKGTRKGYTIDENCREYIAEGIIDEKNDGKYYGFRTLDKMFDSIIYEKVRYNFKNNLSDKTITPEQMKEFLNVSGSDEDSVEKLCKGLVGVEDILKEVDEKIKQIQISLEMVEKGNRVSRPSIHMMFKGSPGTGKTTIARIVARKLKDAGILSKGNLYEIKGRDLCGRYIGETTPKTSAYCRDAYGSVLFIDEAYELYRGGEDGRDYGREAITALVAEMENHRNDMCVIFAGYSKEMEIFLKGNPGLESRIPIIIDFKNYTRSELEEIFFSMMDKNFSYDEELKAAAHEYFETIPDKALNAKEFSNARFVRNLFENVWGAAALRQDLDGSGSLVIKKCDFEAATNKVDFTKYEDKKRPIGFV